MFDDHVLERSVPAGHTLASLRESIDGLLQRGQPEWSEYRVADRGGSRTLTARWAVEQCWADQCERVGVRSVLPNKYDDPYAKFCANHDWSDVSDEDEA